MAQQQVLKAPFKLAAPAGSDIWKKPPSTDDWSATTTLSHSTPLPLTSFNSARVSFKATWTEQFDQAGILLVLTPKGAPSDSPQRRWIKCGLEKFSGEPRISFVGCDRFADWSVHPVGADATGPVSVELRREKSPTGDALWAYELLSNGERRPFRECTWLWHQEEGTDVRVAAYCCRPAKGQGIGELEVEFLELDVVTNNTA